MNTTRHTGPGRFQALSTIVLMVSAVAALTIAGAPHAAANDVIAVDTSTVAASTADATAPRTASTTPRATVTRPRAITITGHHGRSVALFAKGERIRRIPHPGDRPAVFSGLTAGRAYTVTVGGLPIGTAVPLTRPYAAHALTVSTTEDPGSVLLTWKHRATTATGGRTLGYTVTATSATAPTVKVSVTGRRAATLKGLDLSALYSFTVTPRNDAGTGRATKASMTRSLAQIAGTSVPTVPEPTRAPVAPVVAPPAAPAPSPEPKPTPRPATKTVYVCPDGYTDAGDVCEKTIPYTYTEVRETKPYTFHDLWHMTSFTSYPYPCNMGDVAYPVTRMCGHQTGYTTKEKDGPPAGWLDDGTQFVRDVDVKDPMPSGYSDSGTAWVAFTAKVARVVPA